MNGIKKIIQPGLKLSKASLRNEKLAVYNIKPATRFLNNLGNNMQQVLNEKPSSLNFETKLNSDFIEFKTHLNQVSFSKAFPYTWLRDNCKCSKCYNYIADEIERNVLSLDESIKPTYLKNKGTANSPHIVEIKCK